MKILTILLILLQINTFGYGNYSSPYSSNYNSYNSVPIEQTYRRIGYTTNYGNSFGKNTQQTYSNTRNTSMNMDSKQEYLQSSRTPRKAKGNGSSGGIVVTYETTWQSGFLHTSYIITYTYLDGHIETEKVDSWFGYFTIDSYAQEQAQKRAEQWAASHSVPIGDTMIPFLVLLFLYIGFDIFKKKHNKL